MNIGQVDIIQSISAAGSVQSTATVLIGTMNMVTTVSSGSGVILFVNATQGGYQVVYNGGANTLKVYPPTSAQINGLAVNAAMILATNTSCAFWFTSSTQVVGQLSA